MEFKIKNTSNRKEMYFNILVHSDPGIDKRLFLNSLPKKEVIILSLEDGLLSISSNDDMGFDYVELKSISDVREFFRSHLGSYKYVVIDTVTELSQNHYFVMKAKWEKKAKEKKKEVEAYGQPMWGNFLDDFSSLFKHIRGTPINVIVNAHTQQKEQVDGSIKNAPGISGKSASRIVDWFDECFYLFRDKEDNIKVLTNGTDRSVAKDRSMSLEKVESFDLMEILKKMRS